MAGGWSSGQRKTRLHRRGSKIKHQFFLLCPSVPFHDRKSVLLVGLLSGYMVLEDSPARLVMLEESRKRGLPLLFRTHHGLTSWPCGQLRIKNERQTHTLAFRPMFPQFLPDQTTLLAALGALDGDTARKPRPTPSRVFERPRD